VAQHPQARGERLSTGGRAATLAMLRHKEFARFAIARVSAIIGWEMLSIAVGWQVYAISRDPLALGLVGLSEFVPFVALVLVGGHVADHHDRRVVAVLACIFEAVCVATLLGLTLAGTRVLWPMYLAIGIFGAARAFWSPAVQSILPALVPREDLPRAMALNSLLFQVAVIAGPTLGGLLFLLGARVVYATCLALYLLTAALILGIRPVRAEARSASGPEPGSGHRFVEGLKFVLHNRVLLGLISLDLFAVLFGGAAALLPIFARDILHAGSVAFGLLRTAPGAGAAITGIVLALYPIRSHAGLWMFGGVALFGVATVVFGLSHVFLLSFAALFITGAGDMVSVYVRGIVAQLNTPDAIRGRVNAVTSMFIGASNELGGFESGLTARWFGTVPAVVIGGLATLGVVGLWVALFPPLRRMKDLR
jgi:MFS family permease